MIIYAIFSPTEQDYENSGGAFQTKTRLEKASGQECLVMHHMRLTLKAVKELKPKALVFSGFGPAFAKFDMKGFRQAAEVVKESNLPLIAFCGSHQLIAYIFNKDLDKVKQLKDEPMRKLKPGESDPSTYNPGYFKEWGYYEVSIVRDDPLFKGLPRKIIVPEFHFAEVKKVPRDFVLLATNKNCRAQAFRHKTKPIYGTQFHPEAYTDNYQHGKIILENFFRNVH